MLTINKDTIRTFVKLLTQKGYSDDLISRKLQSSLEYVNWAYHTDQIEYSDFQQIKDEIANSMPYATTPKMDNSPGEATTHTTSLADSQFPSSEESPVQHTIPQKLGSLIDRAKEKLSSPRAPQGFSFGPQYIVGLGLVVLMLTILGAGMYQRFFSETPRTLAYPPTPAAASRVLSFQGRLTDSLGNPISTATNMRFRLYDAVTAGSTLYDSGTCSISPDQDGIHNVLIGDTCGAEIASSVFTENTEVWLGVTVGTDAEMDPRQQIANVPYAMNAETLQGLPVGTEESTIPYINQHGDLLMAASTPQIASTYASETFIVSSAQAITIQSAGSGDVTLTATESGTIKFATGGTQHGLITNTGLFGFGTTGPDAKLDVLYTGGEQLRLTYADGSAYAGFTTNSSGDLSIAASGGDFSFTDGTNTLVAIKDQGVYPFLNLAGKTDTGDPATCAEGDIYYNDTDDTIKICHESNTWEGLDGGGASQWTDGGTTVYLSDTTDEVVIGGSSPLSSGKFSLDGDADQIQLIVQGNATQTTSLAVFEQSDGTDVFTVANNGDLSTIGDLAVNGDTITSDSNLSIEATGYVRIGDSGTPGSASGDDDLYVLGDLEIDGTFYIDGTLDTSFTAGSIVFAGTSGVLAQDNAQFFWDDTNNKLGIGDNTPDGKLEVSGAVVGKALAIFDELGDQDIIAASSSGSTRFRVDNDGTIYGGYLLDISNTAYGIDPAGTSNFGGYSLKVTGGALLAADSGNVGIGDQTPDAKLNVLATTEQLRLDYDDSNYASFTVGSGGDLTIAPTGGDLAITGNGDFSGGLNVASSNHFNIDTSGNVGIGTTAVSTAGVIISKSISAPTINSYAGINQDITYTGTLGANRTEYGIYNNVTNGVTPNGFSIGYVSLYNEFDTGGSNFTGSPTGIDNQVNLSLATVTGTVIGNRNLVNVYGSGATASYASQALTVLGSSTVVPNIYQYATTTSTIGTGSTITNFVNYHAGAAQSATMTNVYGLLVADQAGSNTTNAYGAYISNQTGASGENVGLYIADADDYSIQLASTGGDAASGITFGTDTNLYRSAADTLHTDDALDIDGNFTTDGDVAVNGDDITSDGDLTITASGGQVLLGDTNTLNIGGVTGLTYNAFSDSGTTSHSLASDDDVYVEGDFEVDGTLWADGAITSAGTITGADFSCTDCLDFAELEDTLDLDAALILNQGSNTWTQNFTGTTTTGYTYNADSLTTGIASLTSLDALSTGTGISLSSTSTALGTSVLGGSLANFDWTPGSTTTAATDLFRINIGPNGNVTNLLNITDNGTSVFRVAENGIESAVPHSFTASGDVSIAYDLLFSNQTASYIKSNAPLTIEAGESFESNDLTLKTYNSGDIILDAGGSTTATGSIGFYDSNVKAATVTTPIEFADSATDINSYRTNFTDETLVGAMLELFNAATGVSGGLWTDSTTNTYLTTTTDELIIGGTAPLSSAKVSIDGDADQIQLIVQGNGTQTTSLAVFENSAGTDQLTISNTGDLVATGGIAVNGGDITTSASAFNLVNANATTLNIGGAATTVELGAATGTTSINNALTIDGNTTLGNAASDTVIFTADVASHILPSADDTYTLGDTSNRWADLFLGPDTLHIGTSTTDEGTIGYDTGTNIFTFTNNFGDTNFGSSSDGFNFTLGGGAGDDFIVDSTTLVVESDNDRVGIGTASPDAAWLDIAAATTGKAQLNLTTSVGTNVSAPNSGDLWWNGTQLYFFDGSTSNDLLAGGGGPWTESGTTSYLTDTTDDLVIGDTTPYLSSSKVSIVGDTNEFQLAIVGNSSQTADIFRINNSSDVHLFSVGGGGNVSISGDVYHNSNLDIFATGYVRIGDTGTPGSANGDDDLYVQGDLEVDGEAFLTTVSGAGLSDCDSATSILLWDSTSKTFSCGRDNDLTSLGPWTRTNLTASQTDSQLDRPVSTILSTTTSEMRVPFAGNIVGISVAGSIARSAGSAIFTIFVNGTTTSFTCTIDGTNTQYNACTQASGSDTFSAGSLLDVRVTTNGTWAPTTAEWSVEIWVEMDEGADLAELYNVSDETISAGDIVVLNTNLTDGVQKSTTPYEGSVLGVIATKPGLLLGKNDVPNLHMSRALALSGRVPVKVTSENGPIISGDPITASSIPGVGMKATKSGKIVGYAMTDWKDPDVHKVGEVMLFVNTETYIDLSILTQLPSDASKLIKTALLQTEKLVAQTIKATQATIDDLIVDTIVGRSATLTDAQIENLNAQALKAQTIEAQKVTSDEVSTTTLSADSADISGTLTADHLDSTNIREMRERLEKLASAKSNDTNNIDADQLSADISEIQSYITQLTNEETPENVADTSTYQLIDEEITIDPGTTESLLGDIIQSAQIDQLTVTGTASMTSLTVADAFSAGDVFIQGNTILSMNSELKLGALEHVSIMQGAVVIAANGTITSKGEVVSKKGFAVENESGDRVAQIDEKGSARFTDLALDTYDEATSSAVVIAARDNYRETGLYAPAIKTNAQASGNGILPEGENDILIFHDKITPTSKVSITPTSTTLNKSLYVDKVETCTQTAHLSDPDAEEDEQTCRPYFRVALDDDIELDVTFNWFIIH